MSDSYSVLSEETSANPALPICAIPEFEAAGPVSRNAEIWLYRERTVALLRRYLRISIEVGRFAIALRPGAVSIEGDLLPHDEF